MSIFRNKKRTDFYKGLKDVDFNIEEAFDFEKILEHTKKQSKTILDTIKNWEKNKKHTEKDEYDQYLKSGSQKYLKDIKNSCEELLKCNEHTIKNILQIFEQRLENASKAKFGLFTFGAVLDNKKNKKRLEEITKSIDSLIKKIEERNAILGGGLNTKDKYGYTPLMQAIRKYNPVIAKLLIDKGANLDIQYDEGHTALMWAICKKHTDIAKLLIDKDANLDIQNKFGDTALMKAIIWGNTDIAKLLIDKGTNLDIQNKHGMTPLMHAIIWKNTDIAKLLINKGANLDIQEERGITPLMKAIIWGNTDIAKLLIEKGTNLDIQDEKGRTALMLAIREKMDDIAKLLIDKGANLDIQDKFGDTALDMAKIYNRKNIANAIEEKQQKKSTAAQNKSDNNTNDPGIFKGLPNDKNYCYLNSALQQLYHMTSFRNKVLNFNTDGLDTKNEDNKKLIAVRSVFEHLSSKKTFSTNELNDLRKDLGYKGTQEDSGEHMLSLQDACKRAFKNKKEKTSPTNLEGYETLTGFSVNEDDISIKNGIEKFSQDTANRGRKILLKIKDDKLFTVIILNQQNKRNKSLKIKEKMEFKNTVKNGVPIIQIVNKFKNYTTPPRKLNTFECELVSATIHQGATINSGHYFVYKKRQGSSWVEINDKETTSRQWDEIKNDIDKNATVLTYKLLNY